MTKQNKALGFIFFFVLVVLAIIFVQTQDLFEKNVKSESDSLGLSQDQMGDPANQEETTRHNFGKALESLAQCLHLKFSTSEKPPVSISTIFALVQPELGPQSTADRWMSWHMRDKEGREKKLHLEIAEDDQGQMTKELQIFSIDQAGNSVPLNLDKNISLNPNDEIISHLLKDGEVLYKEKASISLFSGGARIEYTERDGTLSEFEFFKDQVSYRCHLQLPQDQCKCLQ
jgi:hypothetical protein